MILLALLPLLWVVRKTWRPRWWWWALATPLGLAIAATPGLAGHAAVGSWVGVAAPLDTMHVVAMSVWLGGLAALALIVLDRDPDAGRVGRQLLTGRAHERARDHRDRRVRRRGGRSGGRSTRSATRRSGASCS